MTIEEAIEIICDDYCKYPEIESGNRLADICDSCPFNKCEDLRWADCKTEPQNNGYQTFNGTSVYVSRFEDEPQAECEITGCDYHDACKMRGQTDCQWK